MKPILAAIAKDEFQYISEWILHHHRIGFEEIIVYDNESTDATPEVLSFFADRIGLTTRVWKTVPNQSPQLTAYNDILRLLRSEGTWIAYFDIDEFLIIESGAIPSILAKAASVGAGAIAINQRVFGSSGEESNRMQPVLDRFRRCAKAGSIECYVTKSIYNSIAVEAIKNSHISPLVSGTYLHADLSPVEFEDLSNSPLVKTIDYSVAQLNHYITKSLEEFLVKRERGGVAGSTPEHRKQRYSDMSFFHNRQFVSNEEVWVEADLHLQANLAHARKLGLPRELAGGLIDFL